LVTFPPPLAVLVELTSEAECTRVGPIYVIKRGQIRVADSLRLAS